MSGQDPGPGWSSYRWNHRAQWSPRPLLPHRLDGRQATLHNQGIHQIPGSAIQTDDGQPWLTNLARGSLGRWVNCIDYVPNLVDSSTALFDFLL